MAVRFVALCMLRTQPFFSMLDNSKQRVIDNKQLYARMANLPELFFFFVFGFL